MHAIEKARGLSVKECDDEERAEPEIVFSLLLKLDF
jgi:hypothetical protein